MKAKPGLYKNAEMRLKVSLSPNSFRKNDIKNMR